MVIILCVVKKQITLHINLSAIFKVLADTNLRDAFYHSCITFHE